MRGILLLVAVVGIGGCGSAKAGQSCNDPECLDNTTAFFCPNGTYESVPCRGPQGCTLTTSGDTPEVLCDESLDKAGDNCGIEFAGAVLCGSAGGDLQCGGAGQWTAITCPTQCISGQPGAGSCT